MLRNPSNVPNLHSNTLNLFRMVQICIQILQIPFKWIEFAFECFEVGIWIWMLQISWNVKISVRTLQNPSNGLNLHSNTLNLFRMIRICLQMLQILFEWLEFAFECFKTILNASNSFQIVRICIGILQILWNALNLQSNASNSFRKDRIWIRMLPILFEGFEFGFKCFESLSNG